MHNHATAVFTNEEEILPRNLTLIQQETQRPPKTKKLNEPNKSNQQRSNKPYNNQVTQKSTPSDVSTNSNNLSTEPTDIQQATKSTLTTKPQLKRRLISRHIQENINWWQGHITYNKIRTRRYELTPFQLFPYTTPEERVEYYETDENGKYLPGTLRYDRMGARNHCRKIEKIKRAMAKSPCSDTT